MQLQKETPYQTYLKSEAWKCEQSPTGAHVWVQNRALFHGEDGFRCRHCGAEKQFSPPTRRSR